MSAPHEVWEHVKRRVERRIVSRKLRHTRFCKLRGTEAKKDVIEGTVVRLMAPDAALPNALRMRLAPRPLVVKGVPAGWLYWRPISSTLWAEWLKIHENYIVAPGGFWFEKSVANELIDRAIDAERIDYCKATADVGDIDPELLERFTEAGQASASTPEIEHEKQEREDAHDAALEQQIKEKEAEFARLVPLLNAYAGQLTLRQKHAWRMICYEPQLSGKEISEASGVSEAKVSQLRKWFAEMARRFFALCEPLDDSGAPLDSAPDTAIDTTLGVHEPAFGEVEIEFDKDGNAGALNLIPQSWDQGLVHRHHAPDVDAGVSDNVMRGYQRMQKAVNAMQSPHRRQYSDSALMRGGEKHRATSEDRVFAEHKRRLKQVKNKPISEVETAAIEKIAKKLGRPVQELIHSAAVRNSLDDVLCPTISGPPRP